MSRIVVEGSVTPCVELERGERAEVEHSDHVQRLIDGGYVVVVGDAPNGEPEPAPPSKTRRAREPKLPEQSTAQS